MNIPNWVTECLSKKGYYVRLVDTATGLLLMAIGREGCASAVLVEHDENGHPDWSETLKSVKWTLEIE